MHLLIRLLTNYLPYNEKHERELATLIADGDETAFGELYRRLLPYLSGTGIKMLKSQEAVSEVIQESLIRIWLHREKLRTVNYPRSWVFRIFSNECFRYLQKHGLPSIPLDTVEEAHLPAPVNNPEAAFSMQETRNIIHHAVDSLSPRQRQIYKLSREHGLKIPEIAQELGLASRYVKKTLIVALHTIRRQLIKAGKA